MNEEKDNKYDLILELRALHIRQSVIEAELRRFLIDLAQANRTFQQNEVVSVYDEGKYLMDGIVDGAFIFPVSDGLDIKKYSDSPDTYVSRLSEIRYVVKKINKDGSKSAHNALSKGSFSGVPLNDGHYITKKLTS